MNKHRGGPSCSTTDGEKVAVSDTLGKRASGNGVLSAEKCFDHGDNLPRPSVRQTLLRTENEER